MWFCVLINQSYISEILRYHQQSPDIDNNSSMFKYNISCDEYGSGKCPTKKKFFFFSFSLNWCWFPLAVFNFMWSRGKKLQPSIVTCDTEVICDIVEWRQDAWLWNQWSDWACNNNNHVVKMVFHVTEMCKVSDQMTDLEK